MRLHANTVFILENQVMRILNGCIVILLDRELKVNVEAREKRDVRLVYLICLVDRQQPLTRCSKCPDFLLAQPRRLLHPPARVCQDSLFAQGRALAQARP